MASYTKTTNFSAKDTLPSGNANKVVKGSEFDTEFDAIAVAVATKYDNTDLADQSTAEAGTNNTTLMTPLRTQQWGEEWAAENAGAVGDIQALTDPGADRILFWDDSDGEVEWLTPATGLGISGNSIRLTLETLSTGTPSGTLSLPIVNTSTGSHEKATINSVLGVRTITAGDGLTGGGDLSADRTISVDMLGLEDLTDPGGNRLYHFNSGTSTAEFIEYGSGLVVSSDTLRCDLLGIEDLTDPDADRLMYWDDSAGAMNWMSVTGPLSITAGDALEIDVGGLSAHSALGGTDVLMTVDAGSGDNFKSTINAVLGIRTITSGNGLTGGGDLSADRTLAVGAGTGIAVNANDVALSHLGLESLTDPGADRIAFWDDSAGAFDWLVPNDGLTVSGTSLNITFNGLATIDVSDTVDSDAFPINDGGTPKQMRLRDMGVRVVNLTTDQTFALGDANTFQLLTGATDRTWTIPTNASVAFPIGVCIVVGSRDLADLTLSPASGVTLTSVDASGNGDQTISSGGTAVLLKVATDEWMLSGDIA